MTDARRADRLLIETKLHIPQEPGPQCIARPQLLQRLTDDPTRKLTLISAPPGFGKTTLVRQWLRVSGHPAAWLSLDEGDNDLPYFLAYALAALRRIDVTIGCRGAEMLAAPKTPPLDILLASLVNDIAAFAAPLLWVLDDYHVIVNPDIHHACRFLIDHSPANFQLAITSRSLPPFALHQLRARGQLLELRAADLRFTADEAADFLNQALRLDLSPGDLATLENRTEGWAAGLRLAALSMQALPPANRHDFIMAFAGDQRHVADYLLEEALQRQTPAVQDFLLQTSILNRLCGALCEAVTGLDDPVCHGQAYLEWLERTNLFIVALDEQRHWYRYHYLFQQLLRFRLERRWNPGQIAVLHQRASAWFAQHDLLEPALEHALAAGDMTVAVDLMERCRIDLMNREQWSRLEHDLHWFPHYVIENHPALLLARAWLAQSQGRLEEEASLLDRIAELLAQPDREPAAARWQGEVDALRSHLHQSADGLAAAEYARQALERVPQDWRFIRCFAWLRLARFFELEGDRQTAGSAIREALILRPAGGFVRLFVDGGPPVQRLLLRLQTGEPTLRDPISEVLAAFPPQDDARPAVPSGSPDPLSEREISVLRLLDSELSGPEIAAALFISVNTLKTHLKHIYEKIGARSRYEAVARWRELMRPKGHQQSETG